MAMADSGHNDDAPPGNPFRISNLLPYLLTPFHLNTPAPITFPAHIPFGEVH